MLAVPMNADRYWQEYFDAMAGQPPRETLLFALERFQEEQAEEAARSGKDLTALPASPELPPKSATPVGDHVPGGCLCHPAANGVALDLACGEGRDTIELLKRHWCVLAVDSHPEAIRRLNDRVRAYPGEDLTPYLRTGVETFEDLPLPPGMFDLVNASFALPHCPSAALPGLWERLSESIRPGGRFAGQLFGVRDQWATTPEPGVERIFHTRAEVEALLAGFEIEQLDEVARPGKDAFGKAKFWHVFHIVARRRAARDSARGDGSGSCPGGERTDPQIRPARGPKD